MSHAVVSSSPDHTPARWLRGAAIALMVLALASCASGPARNPLATWRKSPNQDLRRPILIVIHFTDQDSVEESLETLSTRNAGGPVSAHYLIGANGKRFQLVSDERRAWHGGAGSWGTITDVNSVSIGIELDNDGHSPFAEAQIDSLLVLLEDLCTRLRIPRTQIVGHEDIAPARKVDPGPLFPWRRLADAGFGRWPAADAPPAPEGFDPYTALRLVGYPIADRAAAVRAFRHHFRGLEGEVLDTEDLRILHSLSQSAAR
ncbi:MAG: N-acetylmuramoyl-L-alanine amidase [Pseudoxanthomonas sp.]